MVMPFDRRSYVRMLYMLNSVQPGQDWNKKVGLEYWLHPAALSQGVGTFSGGVFALTNNGWLNTGTILGVAGSGADFPLAIENLWYDSATTHQASDRGSPACFAIDDSGDVLNSPTLFGDPTHMAIAAEKAGMDDLPDHLIYDSWSSFAVASNNETATGHGFVEDVGSAAVANDHAAAFFSDGTNFKLRSNTATSAALKAIDTNFHHWRVDIDRLNQLAYAYIDDMRTALGSIAYQADEFPLSVGAGVLTATGANKINWGPTRVRYAWSAWGL